MAKDDNSEAFFSQEDHQVAYIFDPDQANGGPPAKKRRMARKSQGKQKAGSSTSTASFVPLLNGAEKPACVQLRKTLYEQQWNIVETRIQTILRSANSTTLDQVVDFVKEAKAGQIEKIPSAFIITGPNIASQELLFDQLAETLQSTTLGRFVRIRSSEAATLKSVLKKVIRQATAKPEEEDEDEDGEAAETGHGDGLRYLDYDLEALHAFIKTQECDHVYVAFQDSEAFDSSLLSDLISLFRSWRPRIPFTLLFGIATSVELLQARLLKSACRQIYGGQFDGVQSEAMLEIVFKGAVAASDVPLRMGPSVLRWMLERQRDQMAGIQSFASSLKYAYMCHFYANPLSVILSEEASGKSLQAEHIEALRNTPSFQVTVERLIESEESESLQDARSLLEDDEHLIARVNSSTVERKAWLENRLRSILIVEAAGIKQRSFSSVFMESMSHGLSMGDNSDFVDALRRQNIDQLQVFINRVLTILREGDESLALGPSENDEANDEFQTELETLLSRLVQLKSKAEEDGTTVRSKYSGHGKVMRTTVIAQKVQLSQDSAALSPQDKEMTEIVDGVTALCGRRNDEATGSELLLSEGWLYDSRSPLRDVFVPRPRAVFERSLSRPHDYLNCSCCQGGHDGIQATLPVTSILYQLYQETGSLINVADLWSAFTALMRDGSRSKGGLEEATQGLEQAIPQQQQQQQQDQTTGEEDEAEAEANERKWLVMFYRGLAELRALGYVKTSRKKTDHIAKVKWL